MATVQDLIDEASVDVTTEGLRATRVFLVDGLTGDGHFITYNAYFADGVPHQGDAHPSVPNLVVESLSARHAGGKGIVKVTATYKPRDVTKIVSEGEAPPVISTGSTIQEDETIYDADGNVIRVYYTSEPETVVNANGTTSQVIKYNNTEGGGRVKRAFPMPIIKFSRRESVNPFYKSLEYTQRVNSVPFYGFPARTWLINNISSTSIAGGIAWDVEYELQYNPNTWDGTVVFTDKETGDVPSKPEPSEGNGLLKVKLYKEVDFAPLNLEIPL